MDSYRTRILLITVGRHLLLAPVKNNGGAAEPQPDHRPKEFRNERPSG